MRVRLGLLATQLLGFGANLDSIVDAQQRSASLDVVANVYVDLVDDDAEMRVALMLRSVDIGFARDCALQRAVCLSQVSKDCLLMSDLTSDDGQKNRRD